MLTAIKQAIGHALLFPPRPKAPASLSAYVAAAIWLCVTVVWIGFEWLTYDEPVVFDGYGLLVGAGSSFLVLFALLILMDWSSAYVPDFLRTPRYEQRRLASVFGMWFLATLGVDALLMLLQSVPVAMRYFPEVKSVLPFLRRYGPWLWYGIWVYWALVSARVLVTYTHKVWLGLSAAVILVAMQIYIAYNYNTSAWQIDYRAQAEAEAEEEPAPRLTLTQEVFEKQVDVFSDAVWSVPDGVAGTPEVFAIVYAPHANDGKVFLNENRAVSEVLAQRYDAQARTIQLVNHATVTDTVAWATPTNLRRSIAAVAKKMNPNEDVLMLYATSHGGRDATLSSSHWPLQVSDLTAAELAQMLDDYGVRYRVIMISACYSGSWIDALANDNTLLMTAADATHTSYGCGKRSEMTFFGRALFDEQLRKPQTLEEAFHAAKPIIKEREEKAGKDDGFSNPQMRVGKNIRPVLEQIEP